MFFTTHLSYLFLSAPFPTTGAVEREVKVQNRVLQTARSKEMAAIAAHRSLHRPMVRQDTIDVLEFAIVLRRKKSKRY